MYKDESARRQAPQISQRVGQTMRLNPHGDAAIYETMVRLSKGYGALLTPFVDSKGNFGKVFSRDRPAALALRRRNSPIAPDSSAALIATQISFVDNYDGSMKEAGQRRRAGVRSATLGRRRMASQICGFHLEEVCRTTIASRTRTDCSRPFPTPTLRPTGEICDDRGDAEVYSRRGSASDARPLAPPAEGKHHRDLRDPVFHDRRGRHRQGGRTRQGGQVARWPTCATTDLN